MGKNRTENMVWDKGRIFLENKTVTAVYDRTLGGFTSLTCALDGHKADFVLTPEEFPEYAVQDCRWLGNLVGKVEIDGADYCFSTGNNRENVRFQCSDEGLCVEYPEILSDGVPIGLKVIMQFRLEKETLRWNVHLLNNSQRLLRVTELEIPLLMNQYFRKDDDFKYDRCVLRHTCIVGHSSYLYWEKSSGNAPLLLLASLGEGGFLNLKKAENEEPFGPRPGYEGLVSACILSQESCIGGGQEGLSLKLSPGEKADYEFAFCFLEKESQIDEALTAFSLTCLKAVPGMVGPIDGEFIVMTRPAETRIEICEKQDQILDSQVRKGWRITRLRFGDCGRRYVRVHNGKNIATYCFFATEPVEDIIDRHAAFIAQNQLETDPQDPCYHGILMWDMGNKRRINSSFNPYREDWWRGGSDDPGLAAGLFLADKNVYRVREEEVRVLNAYVEDFILERLTEQPGWRVHRMVPWYTMFEPWAERGADDVWRAYNYVHVINIMRDMYLIQSRQGYGFLRPAREYLKMAYEYAKAMFCYWMYPDGVGASEYGNMGESTLPLYLADELKHEGMLQEAADMDALFDKKAYFFAGKNYPFGSEMVYDSTAFEAVYAYGKRIEDGRVMKAAAQASFANRGKQPVWFLYNTDVRGGGDSGWNSSYMTQLGAWPILDYSLVRGHIDEEWVLSGYGACLSGWLIYNSGGCWDKEEANRGATGWITIASLINHTGKIPGDQNRKDGKLGMPLSKGCVTLSGEAGIGFFGALRTICSVVMEHSILGRIGLGCCLERKDGKERILPRDGLGVRMYHIPGRWRAEAEGGRLIAITVLEDGFQIEGTVLSRNCMTVRIWSIPEPDGEAKLLWTERIEKEK